LMSSSDTLHSTPEPVVHPAPTTPTSPSSTPTSSTTPQSAQSKKRSRGNYNCGKCGQKKRGHVCTVSGQPDASAEKVSKTGTPGTPVNEGANATLLATMYTSPGIVTNHAAELAENQQLKNENEHLKKVVHDLEQQHMYLQQENNNLRAKIYDLTAQLQAASVAGAHDRDLLIYKATLGSEVPSIAETYVPQAQGDIRNHMVEVDNSQAASDLNDLSNVAQQIGERANEGN
jgi:regulator of replication initiation timing